jgi:hypothetical protein
MKKIIVNAMQKLPVFCKVKNLDVLLEKYTIL